MKPPRLLTIPFSHFNEKARWGLDRCGIAHREIGALPGLHVPMVAWQTRSLGVDDPDGGSRFATPVLVPADGPPVHGSSAILRWAEARGDGTTPLYPAADCARLDMQYAQRLGVPARLFAYGWLVADAPLAHRFAAANAGALQARAFRALWPSLRAGLRRGFGITPASIVNAQSQLRAEVAAVSRSLGRHRYLVGTRFTAADLALACMLAPALLVQREEGFGAWYPGLDEVPQEIADFARELRATRAGAHALRMFAEERRRSARA